MMEGGRVGGERVMLVQDLQLRSVTRLYAECTGFRIIEWGILGVPLYGHGYQTCG